MIVIFALCLAAGVLYLWLAGHWFGRVLAFIVLAIVIGGGGVLFGANAGVPGMVFGGIAGAVLAWIIASLPMIHQGGELV